MQDARQNPYDAVLYPSHCFPQTHPDRLAALAALFGMQPARVESCRVLELGCGDGSNLIPMALGLPDSLFLGVDSARRPLERGRSIIAELGLANIALEQADILEISPDLGRFDYVICHGVFSWVPEEVRRKILAVCRDNLAPQGVAYVSYNAYPGWHIRRMVREMMLFHVGALEDPSKKIAQGRALIAFLAEAQPDASPLRALLEAELKELNERKDEALFHDELAAINRPFYFHEFMELAAAHGLRYLAEAEFADMFGGRFGREVREKLHAVSPDLASKEQYLDFLKCRRFRQTLLCREGVPLARELAPERMKDFFISARLKEDRDFADAGPGAELEFQGMTGSCLKTGDALVKAALITLGRARPQALHFEELLARVGSELRRDGVREKGDEGSQLAEVILACLCSGLVELRTRRPRLAASAGERPAASPLARLQARSGSLVTGLLHNTVALQNPLLRELLQRLDGTCDRAELLEVLRAQARSPGAAGDLPLPERGDLERALTLFARAALLFR